jgi:hypothetical protein
MKDASASRTTLPNAPSGALRACELALRRNRICSPFSTERRHQREPPYENSGHKKMNRSSELERSSLGVRQLIPMVAFQWLG